MMALSFSSKYYLIYTMVWHSTLKPTLHVTFDLYIPISVTAYKKISTG